MHKPLAAASLLLVTLLAAAAHAHAFLDHASPSSAARSLRHRAR